MKVKTAEASGKVLDYLVAVAEYTDGREVVILFSHSIGVETAPGSGLQFKFWPSTDWAQGGPIIEREKIGVLPDDGHRFSQWRAFCWHPSQHDLTFEDATSHMEAGPTPLIAAMRCFVVSRLGDEVDVPEELPQ